MPPVDLLVNFFFCCEGSRDRPGAKEPEDGPIAVLHIACIQSGRVGRCAQLCESMAEREHSLKRTDLRTTKHTKPSNFHAWGDIHRTEEEDHGDVRKVYG